MSICPTCGRPITAACPSGNGRTTVMLEVPRAALPALAHALAIGRNTQMMCQAPEAEAMMKRLHDQVDALIPEAVALVSDRHWAAIGARVLDGECFEIDIVKERHWKDAHKIWIRPAEGGRAYPVGRFLQDEFELARAEIIAAGLREEIERIAPLRTRFPPAAS